MASKKFLHDLDLIGVSELKSARIHNVSAMQMAAMQGGLGFSNVGMIVYNTTDSTLYTWNGSSFDKYAYEVLGDVQFKGVINPVSSASIVPAAGHQYVVDTAGELSTQTGTITYSPSATVEVGDVVLFTSATTASIIERSLDQATTSSLGTIRIAEQGEVDAGVVADEAVTPATLHGYVNPEFAADRARLTQLEADSGTLAADLLAETSAREAADTTLQNNIDTEEAARIAADTTLQLNIDSEASARAAAVTSLQNNINDEAALRIAGDATLQANIDSAIAAGLAADAVLAGDIATEAAARSSADTLLQDGIQQEAASRVAADSALQDNIDAEATARAAADTALDGRVTTLEGRANVLVYTASANLVSDTAVTISHNLNLTNKDVFVINVMDSGEQVSVAVNSVDEHVLTLTSSIDVTGAVVTIIGF